MITVFKRLNLLVKIGIIGGLLGGLAGLIVVFIVDPIIGVICVVVFVPLFYFSLRAAFGSMILQEELRETGVQAEATILEVRETGVTVNQNYPLAKLTLQVRPPQGEPFTVTMRQLINRFDIPNIQPGAVVSVLYDPKNHKKIALGSKGEMAGTPSQAGTPGQAYPPSAGVLDAQTLSLLQQHLPPEQMQAVTAALANQDPEKTRMVSDFLTREDQKNAEIRATGKPARAKIITAAPLGINANGNNPAMTFVLEVYPEGEQAFQAQTTGVIAEVSVPKYQPGAEIYVKYDPADRSRVSLDHS
ncbi:MAG: hypothetical protein AB1384_06675 [Actinomycetota bacterium]